MNIKQFMRLLTVDPVNLSAKGKGLAVIACFVALLMVVWVTQLCRANASDSVVVASMAASAVILFIIPNSPLAQPWPLLGGHTVSAMVGIACTQLVSDAVWAIACAVGASVLAMLLLRCLHPPGAATALVPVIAAHTNTALDYSFVLLPVGLNAVTLLMMAIVLNRWMLGYQYPVLAQPVRNKKSTSSSVVEPLQRTDVSEQEMEQALENLDRFMDVTAGDLSRLLTEVQMHRFKRYQGNITCADIMVKNLIAVEYGTEVEDAWQIMHREQLKALPVIDGARRVIGIITWNDFFKFIDLSLYASFQDKFRTFIRRTPDISTYKPEAVGQLMSSPATVLPENTHIANLIPLMSNDGYRQIPIVNHENRLVGMVYQANLIAALYNDSHNHAGNQ